MTLDQIIDHMFDTLHVPRDKRLLLVDAATAASETFRKNAVWFFNTQNYYKMSDGDVRSLIANMHTIQAADKSAAKKQVAYIKLQAIQEKYGMKADNPLTGRDGTTMHKQ